MEEGEGRTRGPLEDAKGQSKDPHRSALGAERQVLLHSLNSSMWSISGKSSQTRGKKEKRITECPKAQWSEPHLYNVQNGFASSRRGMPAVVVALCY